MARTMGGVAKNAGGKQGGHRACAKQQQHGDEIGEGRHRLHEVKGWRNQPAVHARRKMPPDAEGQSGDDAEGHANHDERQGEHGIVPHVEQDEREESEAAEQRQAEAAKNVAQPGHDKDHAKPRQPRQGPGGLARAELESLGEQVEGKAQRHFNERGNPAGHPGEIRLEPGHEGADPVLEGNDQAIGIFGQRRQRLGNKQENGGCRNGRPDNQMAKPAAIGRSKGLNGRYRSCACSPVLSGKQIDDGPR